MFWFILYCIGTGAALYFNYCSGTLNARWDASNKR